MNRIDNLHIVGIIYRRMCDLIGGFNMTQHGAKISKLENDFTRRREQEINYSRATNSLSSRRKKRAMVIVGVFLFFAMIFTIQIVRARANYADVNVQIAKQRGKYHHQQAVHKSLNARVSQLNDKNYVEKIIRDRYYYTKPGETVYSFPNKAPKDVNDVDE